jgi:hypothetical protein
VVNVTNRADVYVRFITFKLCLSHDRGALSFGGQISSPFQHRGRRIVEWAQDQGRRAV